MRELIAVILLLMIFASGKADEPSRDISTGVQNETQVYYVNPDGGTRYHTRRDCPSMNEKYHSGMVAYTADELPQGLKSCPFCVVEALETSTPEAQQVYYVNPSGGKRYHTRWDCYSIDEQYRNGMDAYTADALPEGLKPCAVCGATALPTPTPEAPRICFYVNPDGGTRYHTRRDCPSISEKYHSGMVAYEEDALPQGLIECQICKNNAYQPTNAAQTTLTAGTYIVGVDIPQGVYDFIADENADGTLTIYAWDGSVEQTWPVSVGWQGSANLSNEQVLEVPRGCHATWHLSLMTSAFDTGTRNLRLNGAGTYREGADLAAGLYIVQNNGDAPGTVSLLNSADGAPQHVWLAEPGEMITIYVRQGCSARVAEGCLLRSMTSDMLLQEGMSASITHGRYAGIMQLPGRKYTVTGQDDTSFVAVTDLQKNETHTYKLQQGESFTLDLQNHGAEYMVEFKHVDIHWEQGSA